MHQPKTDNQIVSFKGLAWSITAVPLSFALYFFTMIASVIALLGISLAVSVPFEQSFDYIENHAGLSFVMLLIAETATVALLFAVMKLLKINWKDIGLIKNVGARDLLFSIIGFAVYFLMLIVGLFIASLVVPGINLNQEQQLGFSKTATGLDLVFIFASLVILPAFVEELITRGFLFSGLRKKLNFVFATLITSVMFAAAHLQWGSEAPLLWVAAIDTFILSLVLCYLREKTKSLWPAIILHGIKNTVAYTFVFLIKS